MMQSYQFAGSSPLARGTRQGREEEGHLVRLIPARAGNTLSYFGGGNVHPAHPRSRGEHSNFPRFRLFDFGSSPLARGTHRHYQAPTPAPRLIPARAGNTGSPAAQAPASPAHPRSRGEHLSGVLAYSNARGSSPLARGTRRRFHPRHRSVRLIPARAGNTIFDPHNIDSPAAHPRSRGEHPPVLVMPISRPGSSPLARGTRVRKFFPKDRGRLIPARAGNTM